MSTLAFAVTKSGVSIVQTTERKNGFQVIYQLRLVAVPNDWVSLVKSIESVIQSRHKAVPINRYVIVKAGAGLYAASPDTYKAEGFVEFVLGTLGKPMSQISKQSLSKALGCAKKQKWQDAAEAMFNGQKQFKGFSQGFDAACAGAWSVAT